MWNDFKEFISRGNILDLAVGVIIGGAFGKLVSSFVADIIMPPIGLLLAGVNFKDLFVNLGDVDYPTLAAAEEAGAPVMKYGLFINNVIDFLIVALVIFLLLRFLMKMRKPVEEAVTEKECPYCKSQVPIGATRCPHCTSELE